MNKKTNLFGLSLFAVLAAFVITAPLAYLEYPSPTQQIRDGVDPQDIQCNAERVHVIRSNGFHACVKESTAQKLNWEIVIPIEAAPAVKSTTDDPVSDTKNDDEFTVLSVTSPVEFVDDGREIKRTTLQAAPAPSPWYDVIMDAEINPDNVGDDNLARVSSTPHEKYSVNPGVGFYIEDWMPTHILDGQKLLYADNGCYPSGNCYLRMQFVPTSFVLNENVTTYDLDVSKGYGAGVGYNVEQLDEVEDDIEHVKEIFDSQPGNYGEGFREMTRDGKTVYAYEGGTALNHYRAHLSFNFNEHISFGVGSGYHTLDELLPVFNSIGN